MTDRPEDRWPDFVPPEDSPLWGDAQAAEDAFRGFSADVGPGETQPRRHQQFAPDNDAAAQRRFATESSEQDYRQFAPPSVPTSQTSQRKQRSEHWFNRPADTQSMVGQVNPQRTSVTMGLIIACVIVWALQLLNPRIDFAVSLIPKLVPSEPWRLLTSAFAHGGLTHIGFNMLMLYLLGRQLEDWLGKGKFLTVYLLSAFGGSAFFVLLANPGSAAVGASGAIFGLFGAFFVLAAAQKQPLGSYIGLLAINVVLALLSPGIAWQAHLGGALVGAAAMAIYLWDAKRVVTGRSRGEQIRPIAWAAFVVLVLVLCGAMFLKLS